MLVNVASMVGQSVLLVGISDVVLGYLWINEIDSTPFKPIVNEVDSTSCIST